MKKAQKRKDKKIPEEEGGRRKRPSMILCMMILDLVLICVSGVCMYHFYMPKRAVEASEVEENKLKQQLSEPTKDRSLELEREAKEIYKKTPELLILVNAEHELSDDYKVELANVKDQQGKVAQCMVSDLEKMLEDGEKQGYSFCIVSSYRDAEYQKRVIQNDIQRYIDSGISPEKAFQLTMEQVMPAGCSEHETGLAVDITSRNYIELEQDQENTPDNQWMRENCWKYGFIVRYPAGKTSITGISYEPWHFRYVGKEAAIFLQTNHLTLDEFWKLIES